MYSFCMGSLQGKAEVILISILQHIWISPIFNAELPPEFGMFVFRIFSQILGMLNSDIAIIKCRFQFVMSLAESFPET